MELMLNKVANFAPSIERSDSFKEREIVLNTSKLSPSDIPEEVEVTQNDSILEYCFYYSIMESRNDLKHEKIDNSWSFSYSPVTGRIYSISYSQNVFKIAKKRLKEIADSFIKKRIKDNIKFGMYLINQINQLL